MTKTIEQNKAEYLAALASAIWEDSGFKLTYAEAKAQAIAMTADKQGE